MYQALYRKYRPQTFDDVIGQKHITDSLKKQVETGRLSHAYIFIGTRGTGKTTCARILAKAVNCENPVNGNPCCECEACRGISDGSIMDIVELDAASNNGVDNVRALREEAVFSPANVKKRVYIIDEVHMLSTSAFNALLKILEEPPEHLIFVLATTELQKVPATILSRCQRHSFKRIENEELSDYLLGIAGKENMNLSKEGASLISSLAEGSVRDALSMLDQCSTYENIGIDEVYASVGLAGNKRIVELFGNIMSQNVGKSLECLDELWRDGKDISGIFKELSGLCRDVLIYSMAPKNAGKLIYGGYEIEDIKSIASRYSSDSLLFVLNALQDALDEMKDKLSPKMTAELCIVNLGLESKAPLQKTGDVQFVTEKKPEAAAVKTPEPPKPEPIKIKETDNAASEAPESVPTVNKTVTEIKGESWDAVREAVKPKLPFDMKAALSGIDGTINDMFLDLNINTDFLYGRFNRPEVVGLLETAAEETTGRKIKVRLNRCEPAKAPGSARSLDELKGFEEINWR